MARTKQTARARKPRPPTPPPPEHVQVHAVCAYRDFMFDKPWLTNEEASDMLQHTLMGWIGWAREYNRVVWYELVKPCKLSEKLSKELIREIVIRLND